MLRRFIIIFLLLAATAPATHAGAAPARVVSLKPNVTDIVFALGEGEKLVGITRYCDVPEGKKRPAIVADYTQPYLERIIELSPELIIGSMENSSRKSVETLTRAGFRVELFPFGSVEETMSSVKKIAAVLGVPEKGESVAKKMADDLSTLKNNWSGKTPVGVVVVWGLKPLVVAGPGTYMDELLKYISATNVINGTKIRYPRIGVEELIAKNPDAIIDLSMGSEREDAGKRPWDGISTISAVKNGHVIDMDASLFRASPSLPQALANLARLLHTH